MGRMEERLKKAIADTAKTTKKVVKQISENPKSAKHIAPHRHCVICHAPIPLDADPAHCGDEHCSDKTARQEKSRKRLNLMLYLFPGIAIMLFVLPIVGIL
jgi:predicted nucleic acid-binding Zn ribbon protein